MNEQKQLALGIKIASVIHYGQFDRGGKPYILHPLFLMNQLLFDTQLATIAVMHDVVEDGDIMIEDLISMGFSARVTDALELLTHDEDDDYPTYINKMEDNYDAIRVKRKDIDHNSRTTRLKGVTDKDTARIVKYHGAFLMLGQFKKKFKE